MTKATPTLDTPLTGLSKKKWLNAVAKICESSGAFQPLGKRHFAALIEASSTLLVTFETVQGMQALSDRAQPLGWDMVRDHDWSHLCIASDGDTWFRDEDVFAYVDDLTDEGFFDEFDQVIFYGAGPCAYAACAFSVAAPGSRVLAIQPQATLDPRITEWDERFVDLRRTDFTQRYGYGPDMLDGAEKAYVLYDPYQRLDAMHVALFTRENVVKLRMPFMGEALQTDLLELDQMTTLLTHVATDTLSTLEFARLQRARRDYPPYLRNLMAHLDRGEREELLVALCTNVTSRMHAPRFARKLSEIRAAQISEDQEEPRRQDG